MQTGGLKLTTPSEREIAMTREFNAPRRLVFDAYTKCDLLKRWLFGPDGWSLAVCEVDLRVGGKYRYVWRKESKDMEMGMGGVFREIVVPERIVCTEKFDEAWYPGEALSTLVLVESAGRTTLTQTLLYESREARDMALKSGMDAGMEMGFVRLEKILVEMGS